MKWNESNWRPYGVLNPSKTRQTHAGKITQAKKIPYNEIIHDYFEDNVIQRVIGALGGPGGSMWFEYAFRNRASTDKKGAISKRSLSELKTRVNYCTREEIQKSLEYNGYPPSWDTAFYMAHYTKINALMKRITKELVRNYL